VEIRVSDALLASARRRRERVRLVAQPCCLRLGIGSEPRAMRRGTLFGSGGGTGLPVTRRAGGGRGGSGRVRPTFLLFLVLVAVSLASTVFLYFWCGCCPTAPTPRWVGSSSANAVSRLRAGAVVGATAEPSTDWPSPSLGLGVGDLVAVGVFPGSCETKRGAQQRRTYWVRWTGRPPTPSVVG